MKMLLVVKIGSIFSYLPRPVIPGKWRFSVDKKFPSTIVHKQCVDKRDRWRTQLCLRK